jgi:hypothetical protein
MLSVFKPLFQIREFPQAQNDDDASDSSSSDRSFISASSNVVPCRPIGLRPQKPVFQDLPQGNEYRGG